MKKQIVFILFCSTLFFPAFSQKSFSEIDANTFEKKSRIDWKKTKDKSGQGFSDLTGLKISKVALVSFSAFMPPDQDKYGSMTVTSGASGGMIQAYANTMHDESLDAMKAAFQNHGIELIARDDFSEDQKSLLNNLSGSNWLKGKISQDRTSYYSSGYASWYKTTTWELGRPAYDYKHFKSVVVMPKDYSMFGILAKGLGVDAILIINHQFDLDKGAVYSEFQMTMVGMNPISFETAMGNAKSNMHKKLIEKNYFEGVPYIASTYSPSKPIEVAERKKNQYGEANWNGFSDFIQNAVDVTLTYFDKRTE
jgi:hypothetical protein